MTDYFGVELADAELKGLGVLALAHVGDAVFDLLVRSWLCSCGTRTALGLHRAAVRLVCAGAQARAAAKLLPLLSDSEAAVFRRGRNAKVGSVPKNAEPSDYHDATGLEALLGYLYLKGDRARINELFAIIVEDNHAA